MNKNNTEKKRRGIFVKLTREKSKEDIRELREKRLREGKDITKKEKHEIIRKNAKRAKIKTIIYAMGAGLFISGAKTANLLNEINERNKTEITVDADQYKNGIYINNVKEDKNKLFVNGLKVDLEEVDLNEQIEINARAEVNNLKNSDEVLIYIKQIYADEVNERNPKGREKVTADDILLRKQRAYIDLYRDRAKNGDMIIREVYGDKGRVDTARGLMSARVNYRDGEESESESAIWDIDSYKKVYSKDEEVEQDKESILVDIGGIIENGIDYYSGFIDENESDIYKNRLINSVIEYKKSKIKEITQKPTKEQTSDGYDIEQ